VKPSELDQGLFLPAIPAISKQCHVVSETFQLTCTTVGLVSSPDCPSAVHGLRTMIVGYIIHSSTMEGGGCVKVRGCVWNQTRKSPHRQTLSFFFFFRWASSKWVTLLLLFSHKTATFYTKKCTSPLLFHDFKVSLGCSNPSLKNYGFIYNTIFFTCTHAHKTLSNET